MISEDDLTALLHLKHISEKLEEEEEWERLGRLSREFFEKVGYVDDEYTRKLFNIRKEQHEPTDQDIEFKSEELERASAIDSWNIYKENTEKASERIYREAADGATDEQMEDIPEKEVITEVIEDLFEGGDRV